MTVGHTAIVTGANHGIGGLVIPLVLLFTWLRRSRRARGV